MKQDGSNKQHRKVCINQQYCITFTGFNTNVDHNMHDLRLPLQCKFGLCSSGMLTCITSQKTDRPPQLVYLVLK